MSIVCSGAEIHSIVVSSKYSLTCTDPVLNDAEKLANEMMASQSPHEISHSTWRVESQQEPILLNRHAQWGVLRVLEHPPQL